MNIGSQSTLKVPVSLSTAGRQCKDRDKLERNFLPFFLPNKTKALKEIQTELTYKEEDGAKKREETIQGAEDQNLSCVTVTTESMATTIQGTENQDPSCVIVNPDTSPIHCLPNEIMAYLTEFLTGEDGINLSYTSRHFQLNLPMRALRLKSFLQKIVTQDPYMVITKMKQKASDEAGSVESILADLLLPSIYGRYEKVNLKDNALIVFTYMYYKDAYRLDIKKFFAENITLKAPNSCFRVTNINQELFIVWLEQKKVNYKFNEDNEKTFCVTLLDKFFENMEIIVPQLNDRKLTKSTCKSCRLF